MEKTMPPAAAPVPPSKANVVTPSKPIPPPDLRPMVKSLILAALGVHPKLHSIRITQVTPVDFRVNVMITNKTGPFSTAEMSDSFFVKTSEKVDKIVQSNPPIKRKYGITEN